MHSIKAMSQFNHKVIRLSNHSRALQYFMLFPEDPLQVWFATVPLLPFLSLTELLYFSSAIWKRSLSGTGQGADCYRAQISVRTVTSRILKTCPKYCKNLSSGTHSLGILQSFSFVVFQGFSKIVYCFKCGYGT